MSVVSASLDAPAVLDSVGLRRGEHEDLASYFSTNMPMLRGYARKIAGGVIDPQDLLADAVASVVLQTSRGRTITLIGAYLCTTMRNRVLDERRSPRARVVPLNDEDVPGDDDTYHAADMFREYALVRRALSSLPRDHQRALLRVVVNEERPRDLVSDFARPASSISSLVYRAKLGLRRAILRELIVEGARGTDCRDFADALPDIFPIEPELARTSPGFDHLGGCGACAAAWERFAALPGC